MRGTEKRARPSRELELVQLELEGDVLAAIAAVVVREAAAGDAHILAHVDGPGVVGVAAEEAVGADLDAVGPDEVGVVAAAVAGQSHVAEIVEDAGTYQYQL